MVGSGYFPLKRLGEEESGLAGHAGGRSRSPSGRRLRRPRQVELAGGGTGAVGGRGAGSPTPAAHNPVWGGRTAPQRAPKIPLAFGGDPPTPRPRDLFWARLGRRTSRLERWPRGREGAAGAWRGGKVGSRDWQAGCPPPRGPPWAVGLLTVGGVQRERKGSLGT